MTFWRQGSSQHQPPVIDVRRDFVTLAWWWPIVVGAGVVVGVGLLFVSAWVWYRVTLPLKEEGVQEKPNGGMGAGMFGSAYEQDIDLEERKLRRIIRDLQEALASQEKGQDEAQQEAAAGAP